VILADRSSRSFRFEGVSEALALGSVATPVDLRLFGKPETLSGRRMGVALARASTIDEAVSVAKAAAAAVTIACDEEN
jgi:phosphoribosylglycinamide formyltransferase 2